MNSGPLKNFGIGDLAYPFDPTLLQVFSYCCILR